MNNTPKEKDKLTYNELLEQRKELHASIQYASFIQHAMQPEMKDMNKLLHDFFILHMPRDIVSGDFYYCSSVEHFTVMAAGDCTGHGVPGALMSIMGISFLNEILSGERPWKASRILNLLRERIMKALHQSGRDEENKDGIDMALCVFNQENGELQFAGANNPLYHVRNGKLTEIKADKMPVGVNAIDEDSFTNHTIRIISDDMIYIFSDGYADQFGGPRGKKYKYGPLKKLLTDVSQLPMDQQHDRLQEEILDWKGDLDQVDDILIFGVRLL